MLQGSVESYVNLKGTRPGETLIGLIVRFRPFCCAHATLLCSAGWLPQRDGRMRRGDKREVGAGPV